LQLGADEEIQRVRGAVGGQDLGRAGVDAEVVQTLAQGRAQAPVAAGVAVTRLHGQGIGRVQAAQGRLQQRRVQPVGRQGAQARRACGVGLEHAADQRRGVHGRLARHGGGRRAGGVASGRGRPAFPHEEAALAARLQQAGRLQLVVGRDDGVWADAVLSGTVAHRRQAGAGQQQAFADALGIAFGELAGQG